MSVQALLDGDEEVVCGQEVESRAEVLGEPAHNEAFPPTILGLPVQFDGKGQNKFAKFYIYRITGDKRALVG